MRKTACWTLLITPTPLKRWRTLEEKRDLPVKIDYLRPGSANYPAKTDYSYDILGRPVTKKDYFNAPAPDLTHTYAYDDRNELVSDAMSRGSTYSYSYDNIGNRKTSLEGTDSLPTAYVANRVNQYTDITEGEEVPLCRIMTPTATRRSSGPPPGNGKPPTTR